MRAVRRPLFILPDLAAGGAERSTLALLADLVARGHEPTLLLIRRRGEWLDRVPAGARLECALGSDAPVARNALAAARKALACARDCDVVVGALEHESSYLAWIAARRHGRPAVGWIHAMMGEHLRELAPAHARLARLVYPRLDRLVFPSRAAADSLAAVARLDRGRSVVIPSAVDVAAICERAKAPLPDWAARAMRAPAIVAVGRLVPSKDHATLIDAHALARRDGVDHRLVILGDGPLRGALAEHARGRGVDDSVTLAGYVPNPHAIVAAAAAFVLPSRFESLSLAMLEALAVGAPVIAAAGPGGPAEALDGGRAGVLVPPGDAPALARAIASLLRDPSARRSLAAAGAVRALAYDVGTIHPRWAALLDSLA